MEFVLAIIVGILATSAFYLMLRRSLVKVILGMVFLGNAVNLTIFSVARVTKGLAAFIPENASTLEGTYADPLPQALILTAIVIGFGTQAFAIALFRKAFQKVGDDDLDKMNSTDIMCNEDIPGDK